MPGGMTCRIQAFINHPMTFCIVEAKVAGGMALITGISLKKSRSSFRRYLSDKRLNAAVRILQSILEGTDAGAVDCELDFSWCTPFQKSVLSAARKIPKGASVTYAELAARAGYPKAVRAAASVMRQNRFPLIIPCHRVIRGDGTTGGFMGKKHGWAIELKRRLLDNEKEPRTAAGCCR